METRKKYKMYKSGSIWIFSAVTLIAITFGIGTSTVLVANADGTRSSALATSANSNSGKVDINKDNFTNYFTQNGSSINNYNAATGIQILTTDSFQSGNVSFNGAINLNNNFEIDGAINLGDSKSIDGYSGVADGIGFVFYKGNRNQVGGTGGDLGIYGVSNAFGWKVDTWLNDSAHSNNTLQELNGDYDDGMTNPYGAFVTTNASGYGSIDKATAVNLTKLIEDGQFHDVKFIYTAANKQMQIILSTPQGDVSFTKTFNYDTSDPVYHFAIASSTGGLPTKQAFRIDSMSYSPIQKAKINYIDDNTSATLSTDEVSGGSNDSIDYTTASKISTYEAQGYQLVSDGFPEKATYDDDDTIDQVFNVHLKHKMVATTEKKTVNETIHYVYKDGSKAFDDYVAKPLEFSRIVSTDAVTGDKTYGDWSADQSFDSVTSPELKGYTPDKNQIDKQTVNGDSNDLEFTVTYTKNEGPVSPVGPKTPSSPTVNVTLNKNGQNPVLNKETASNLPHTGKQVDVTKSLSLSAIILGLSASFLLYLKRKFK